jgi:hypothetical protein
LLGKDSDQVRKEGKIGDGERKKKLLRSGRARKKRWALGAPK